MRFLATAAALCYGAAASPALNDHFSAAVKRDVSGAYLETKAPVENIFRGISDKEADSIMNFLDKQVNKTIPAELDFNSWDMWLLAPNKTDATAYLDGKGKKPKRYARVMGWGPCYTTEYLVGPLPVCTKTKAVPLDWLNGGNATREWKDCDPSDWDDDWDDDWDEDDDDVNNRRPMPGNSTRLGGGGPGDAPPRVHPPDSRRMAKRALQKRKRSDKDSLKTKRSLNLKKSLERRDPSNPYDEEQTWDGDELPHDDKAGPVTILPDGARHEFDPKQNYVSWMGFTFFVATGPGGISIHDVRFRGDRVIYELAMQEALAHYAGPGEYQNQASYLDVDIGFTEFNLIPGFDCPSHATYTDAFCLFEFPKDYPMSRHFEWEYYHATRNTAFMLRSVSTVGNYDYMTTYEFHYDGTINVIVRASGYIQGDDDVEGDEPWEYGFRIRDDLSGSMHDHVLNFKADLDIKGTKNSLFKTEFVPNSQVYEWSEGRVINNMKAERSFVTNEADGKINWAPNSAAQYAVVNKDKPNEFGEYPGFRIFPSVGSAIHLTVENSTVFPNEVQWASHHLYAVQRKDTEPVAIHPRPGWGEDELRVHFDTFFDDESLEQEDLVLYFNLGMHHMPDTYDLPITVFQGAQSGITFRPQNYGRSNAAQSTRQQIHIKAVGPDESDVETYGVKDLAGSYDLSDANPPFLPMPEWWEWDDDEDWDDDDDWEDDDN